MAGDLHSYSRTEAPYFSVNYSPSEKSPYRPDLVRHRLLVDNRDRFDAANTSPFDFRIDFRDTGIERLENVTSVELTSLTVPQVDTDPYVILDSFELGEHMLSSSSSAHQTYNVGIFRGDLKAGNVVTLRQTDMAFPSLKLFTPPLSQLDRISLKLKKYSGSIVQAANTLNTNTVIACFEITTDPSLRRQH
jgi:hypothetical protein